MFSGIMMITFGPIDKGKVTLLCEITIISLTVVNGVPVGYGLLLLARLKCLIHDSKLASQSVN